MRLEPLRQLIYEWCDLMTKKEYGLASKLYEGKIDGIVATETDEVYVLHALNQCATALLFTGARGLAADRFRQLIATARPRERKAMAKWVSGTVDKYIFEFGGDKEELLAELIGKGQSK
jgi:hypothetical protein